MPQPRTNAINPRKITFTNFIEISYAFFTNVVLK